jgi:phosphoadenosine phosphosulfate reductase
LLALSQCGVENLDTSFPWCINDKIYLFISLYDPSPHIYDVATKLNLYNSHPQVSLWWCEDLNIPVLDPKKAADRCSSFIEVRLTQPADPRPAFPADIAITREAVANELGDWELAEVLVPEDEVVLLNKIPGYADQADEVVVRGRLVGHRFYDVLEGRWRFRPLYEGVATVLDMRRGYWAVVDMAELPEGYDIHPERVVEGRLPEENFRHVAVATADGRTHVVAKLFRGRRLLVVK